LADLKHVNIGGVVGLAGYMNRNLLKSASAEIVNQHKLTGITAELARLLIA